MNGNFFFFYEEINEKFKKYSHIKQINNFNKIYYSIFNKYSKGTTKFAEFLFEFYQISKIIDKQFDYELFKSCIEGKLTSVQWFIEQKKVDKNKKVENDNKELEIYEGETPIHIAAKNGHLSIVQYLIEKQNVNKDIKGNYEKTPFHYACEKGHLPIVEYLISKGANIEAKDEHGDYVIHFACKGGHLSIVQYLIEKQNVDKDIKGLCDGTPLHYASEWGETEIVKYLVSKGANKNAKDKDDKTPYDLAYKDEIKNILK